jgi:membrane protein insertase Oxa1/YidC/SpoIIIJ
MTPRREEGEGKGMDDQSAASSRIMYKAAHVVNLFSLVIFSQMPSSILLYILYSCGMSLTEVYVLHRVPLVKLFLLSTIPSTNASTKMIKTVQQ